MSEAAVWAIVVWNITLTNAVVFMLLMQGGFSAFRGQQVKWNKLQETFNGHLIQALYGEEPTK